MPRSRDRLGLLLPLPALLVAEPTSTHAAEIETSSVAEQSPQTAPPPAPAEEPPPPGTEPPPGTTPDRERAAALFEQGKTAFAEGDYATAAKTFEQASEYADLVPLLLDATIAYRFAALEEQDGERATALCEGARTMAARIGAHPDATAEEIEQAMAETAQADQHCATLEETYYGPCLSPPMEPCLNIIEPRPSGCGSKKGGEDFALLPTLMLMGLRRRKDAVERVADRLPADVREKLRKNADADDEPKG